MPATSTSHFDESFAFYEQLWSFYESNRKNILATYKGITRKFLNHNDPGKGGYLRKPQYEALELYVFVKEVLSNKQMADIFDDWRNQQGQFSSSSEIVTYMDGQGSLFGEEAIKQNDAIFAEIQKYKESYPNYIYALTMGLGKTVLMATCIYYDFLMARKFPTELRYCHNALVFAPDKTVLKSLEEIQDIDKSLIVPPEYVAMLEANVHYHYLMGTDVTLNTIDGSDFNIVISNTQKIIVKKSHADKTPAQELFGDTPDVAEEDYLKDLYGDDYYDASDEQSLLYNSRFLKLCRLPQLGVFVDEAHHMFGKNLVKDLRANGTGKTSLRDTINLLANSTNIVACYNYTGTPYVNNKVLPEVVYSYGLADSIKNGYLKNAAIDSYSNVKSQEFLRGVIKSFWSQYGGKTYENLNPKLAFFASTIEEANSEVKPMLEEILAENNIPIDTILVNVGDATITKDYDIKLFNDLDVPGSEGNKKQFIVLVGKGREGWNCRSLLGVAMFRQPSSKIFVLQATMRCLRKLSSNQLTATVYLSQANREILETQLIDNFRVTIEDLKKKDLKQTYCVRLVPPEKKIKLKRVTHSYELLEKEPPESLDFGLENFDYSKYQIQYQHAATISTMRKDNYDVTEQVKENRNYSLFMLVCELSRFLSSFSCKYISDCLLNSREGVKLILETVSKYNEVIYDVLVPTIFASRFEVKATTKEIEYDAVLLHEPHGKDYYEFHALPELVVQRDENRFSEAQKTKSFHADTYCFDSKPEKQLFFDYLSKNSIKELYFTGMFTSNQGDFMVRYFDPATGRVRTYYPDFIARKEDGSYEIIEVKGDNKIDDADVRAKEAAASELAAASKMKYRMIKGSDIMAGTGYQH